VALRCKGCGAAVGFCSPTTLILGGAVFRRGVSIECAGCGRRWPWHPARPRKARKPRKAKA
jgi:hypothetical protein